MLSQVKQTKIKGDGGGGGHLYSQTVIYEVLKIFFTVYIFIFTMKIRKLTLSGIISNVHCAVPET